MAKKQLNKSYSSFSRDQIVNRAKQVRRDNDTVKTPKCTIEDVDWAIMSYLQDIVKPQIIENGQTIDVPVMYANGEKWAMVQSRGYMRDAKNKIMTPLISIRRGSIIERDTLRKLDVNINPAGNEQILRNKFSKAHRYDRFSILRGQKPVHEFHVMAIPEFIDVSYELFVWTEYTEQMNSLVEQIMPTNGFAYGTTYKFPTYLQDVSFETTNATGEDRVVRATIPATVKGTLLMPYEIRKSNFQKRISVKKVVFGNETDGFNISDSAPGGY